MAKPIPYDDDNDDGGEDERDMRKIVLYDDEALKLMQGWTGGTSDPLYAISSTGGWNYAWVFSDAIANIDRDLSRVKKLGRNKFQLGQGTFTKAEIDELRYIRDVLSMALDDPDNVMVDEARGAHARAPRRGSKPVRAPRTVRSAPKSDRRAYDFFYRHAGYGYGPGETPEQGRKRGAASLAKAEQEATARGWTVEWEEDPEGWDSIGDIDPDDVREILSAVLYDEDHNVLGSLGSIVNPDRNYRRVVEAELALEALP